MNLERRLKWWKIRFKTSSLMRRFTGSNAQEQIGLRKGTRTQSSSTIKASTRKKKNIIWEIENSSGDWLKKAKDVEAEFGNYFTKLFTTTKSSQNQMDAALKGINPRVSAEMNESLLLQRRK